MVHEGGEGGHSREAPLAKKRFGLDAFSSNFSKLFRHSSLVSIP